MDREGSEGPALKRENRYYVYVMASRTRVLYVGVTNDVYYRALQHKAGEIEGFTKRYKVNRLVYYEPFRDVGKAISREKEIKGWRRAKKLALIETDNPTWIDLAEDWRKQVPLRRFTAHEIAEMQIPHGLKPVRNDNPESGQSDEEHLFQRELEKQKV